MTASRANHPVRNVALLAGAAASWGLGTVISKQAVAEMPALTLLAIQLSVSVAVMSVVVRVRGERLPATREGRLLGRLGLLNPGLAYAFSLVGLTGITASLAVLLWAGEPILILVGAAIVLREQAGRVVVGASAVAIAGLFLVVADPGAGGSGLGIALTIAGVLVCALYSVLTRRWLLGTDATFPVVLSQQVHALILIAGVVVVAAAAGQPVLREHVTAEAAVSAAASGLLYYALAYSCYLTALRDVRASFAAAAFYLIPVFGLAGAFVVGERLDTIQWIGAAVVIGAVAVIATRMADGQPSSASPSAQIPTSPIAASRS